MSGSGENVDVDMNISIGGMDVSMDVDINDNTGGTYTSTSTTTTTTTTSGSGTVGDVVAVDHVLTPTAYDDCPPVRLGSVKTAMSNEAFADDQMNVARQALKNSCVTVDQVIDLAQIFTFEDDRLEFAKFAYDRTIDPHNYFEVNSVFTYSSTKDELNEFLETK
jgi:hypothetical protein